jgi:putative ABC transport system permease protein
MIPAKYNLRNLRVRWMTTLMTVVATGLVVCVSVLVLGLIDGIERALRISGQPLDLIVVRKGSTNETASGIQLSVARDIASLPGIAKTASGQPMCSVELVTILTKPRRNNGGTVNLIIRGLEDVGRQLRPDFKITEGRDLQPGVNEAITSRQMAERFENLRIGERMLVNHDEFLIVGYFEADGSSAESEVWTDLRDLGSARRTPEFCSSVNLRAQDSDTATQLIKEILTDKRFLLSAIPEPEYFETQAEQSSFFKYLGYFIAVLFTFAAMFAAANTMYGAVASRGREIGTLRALGFSRTSILLSFLFESLVLCLLGALFGCLATLPLNGFSTGTANFASFSEMTFSFRFGPRVFIQAVILAVAMGLLGGILPALHAVRLNIITALRER